MIGLAGMESPTRYWCFTCRSYIAIPYAHICQECTMQDYPTPVPAPQPSLRKAAMEALVAGVMATSGSCGTADEARAVEARLKKALEQLAEALAQ